MRLTQLALIAAAPVLVAGLAACGSSSDSAKSTTTSSAATTTQTTTPGASTTQSTAPRPLPPNPTRPPVPTTQTLRDVDCGPITGANGKSANVIAYANQAGIPGCTEAITVASDYVNATRTGDAVEVDGWTCEPQPDTAVPHICFRDGFLIGLRGDAAPNPPAPPVTTTSTAPIADVDCGTVTDAGGGTRTVIAVGTPNGVVGCTEAINVATEYAQTITTGDALVVQGWSCAAQGDGAACTKDGLIISLRGN